MMLEQGKSRARCAPKSINSLIGIADGKYIAFLARQFLKNLDLGDIGILKFVDKNESRAFSFRRKRGFVLMKQRMSMRDHVAKSAQIFLAQHLFDRGEDAGNFPASSQHLFVRSI